VAYLGSRLAVLAIALASTWLQPHLTVPGVLAGWDGGWYLRIAQSGYPDNLLSEGFGNRWAFFPALPELIRFGSTITPFSDQTVGLVIVFLLGAAAAFAVWIAVKDLFGETTANGVVLLLCFFPTAYVFSMIYTEGLFIASAAGTLALLRRRRWVWAGLVAGAGALTREPGALLVLICLVEAVMAVRRERRVTPLIAPLIGAAAGASWAAWQWRQVGSPTAFVKAEEAWGPGFDWFRTPFRSVLHLLTRTSAWSNSQEVMASLGVLFVAVGLVLLIVLHRRGERLPVSWWIYTIGAILVAFSPFWPSSILRYTMAVFPLYIGLVRAIAARYLGTVVAVSASVMGAIALVAFASQVASLTAPFAP
jgi:hypothetical protein